MERDPALVVFGFGFADFQAMERKLCTKDIDLVVPRLFVFAVVLAFWMRGFHDVSNVACHIGCVAGSHQFFWGTGHTPIQYGRTTALCLLSTFAWTGLVG